MFILMKFQKMQKPVQRNNAIGAANQKKYENSIIKANRTALAQKFDNNRERTLRAVRESGAEILARNPQISKDVINAPWSSPPL